MRQLRILGSAVIMALTLGASAAAPASAASILPEFATATSATVSAGEGKLTLESTSVTCKKSTGTFGAGTRLGTFKIDFKECKSAGSECKGLGQSTELIEWKGEWHLVSLLAKRDHDELWLLLPASDNSSAVHIECASLGTLMLLWGNVLGSIEEISGRTFKLSIETAGGGATLKQTVGEFGNNSAATVKVSGLKGKLNGGTERPAFEKWSEVSLAAEKATELVPKDDFDAQSGWSAETKGGGKFVFSEEDQVSCEKETFTGAYPTSGDASHIDMAPTYSGCVLEQTNEGNTTTTKATIEAKGCQYELAGAEGPAKGKIESEFDISNCSSGEKSGILIDDSEVEMGHTCQIDVPGQDLGNEEKGDDTKEEGSFESEADIDATDVSSESSECPKGIEEGKEPGHHHSKTSIVGEIVIKLVKWVEQLF
jgi:hypothetical protein